MKHHDNLRMRTKKINVVDFFLYKLQSARKKGQNTIKYNPLDWKLMIHYFISGTNWDCSTATMKMKNYCYAECTIQAMNELWHRILITIPRVALISINKEAKNTCKVIMKYFIRNVPKSRSWFFLRCFWRSCTER